MEIIVLFLISTLSLLGYKYFTDTQKYSKVLEELDKTKKQLSEEEAIQKASLLARDKLKEADQQASKIIQQAKQQEVKMLEMLKESERNMVEKERKLLEKDKILDEKYEKILKKEKALEEAESKINFREKEILSSLEKIANMTQEQARQELQNKIEEEMKTWISKRIREGENLILQEVDEKAKNLLVETMLNAATDYVAETTTTTITITDENLKGKLIGKEGRNIRTFERLTGVDLIVDEVPNQVTISCFDPIRREVGALAIKKLLSDGRVHPGAIEDAVEKVKKDVLKEIKKTGEEMAFEAGINNIPHEVIMLLGRFKYRFSYGQNLVKHTLEMVKIGEALSTELKANTRLVKLACLLHDIGKVAPEEGKQHHHISAEIARKYFPGDEILANAIEAHHFDIEAKSIEAEIVRIADAISGARPGARRDNYEDYIKRIRALEDISYKQKGVKEAYAIHAGREIRVIVKPESTTDEDVAIIARNIAKEIEATQSYPGVIKVSVIRELRVVEEAK